MTSAYRLAKRADALTAGDYLFAEADPSREARPHRVLAVSTLPDGAVRVTCAGIGVLEFFEESVVVEVLA